MSETESPYFKVEKQSPINKSSAMIDDYLSGLKKEFGDLHRAVRDIEAWNEDLRRENGEFLDKLHDKDLEIQELRGLLEPTDENVKRFSKILFALIDPTQVDAAAKQILERLSAEIAAHHQEKPIEAAQDDD